MGWRADLGGVGVFVCVCVGGGGVVTRKKFGRGCAAGTLNTPPIHIVSRLTNIPIHIICMKKIPYSYSRRILVEPKQATYLEIICKIYVHFASCFDYVCGQESCLLKLEINGLLM